MQGIDEAIALLNQISSGSWLKQAIEARIGEFQKAQAQHYQFVAETTPQRVDRGAPGYAIDSGALKRSLEQNWQYIDGQGLSTYSDLSYAGEQEKLLAQKVARGEAKASSLLIDDETAMELLAMAIADWWGN